MDCIKELGPKETFSDLWRDDFLQVMSRVAHRTVHWLNLEPYSYAIFKQGLKVRKVKDDGEECEVLEQALEYARTVGVEVVDMLMVVHEKVHTLEPRVPAQHTFRGDGLQNFIHDYQDRLEHLEHQIKNLTTMTNEAVTRLQVRMEVNRWDLR